MIKIPLRMITLNQLKSPNAKTHMFKQILNAIKISSDIFLNRWLNIDFLFLFVQILL